MKKSGLMNVFQTQYPGPVAVVVSRDPASGRVTMATQGWYMFASYVPPQLALAVANDHATCEYIRAAGEFVLALPSCRQVEAVFFCGTRSGRLHDKTKESGFKTLPAGKVNPPLIVGACANFECQVTAAVQTGSHTLFVGKIVASHMDAQAGDRLFATSDGQFAGFAKS